MKTMILTLIVAKMFIKCNHCKFGDALLSSE